MIVRKIHKPLIEIQLDEHEATDIVYFIEHTYHKVHQDMDEITKSGIQETAKHLADNIRGTGCLTY